MRNGGRTTATLEHLPALDGVRGIAILMVLGWHYYTCVPRPDWVLRVPLLESIAQYGWTGVPLFFALSGFLIGRILVANRGRAGYFKVFYIRRATRILPLYFVALGLFLLARWMWPLTDHPNLTRLLDTEPPYWTYAAFLQNFSMAQTGSLGGAWLGVTWSLAIEEQFYLLLPLTVALVRPEALPRLLGAFVVFSILFRVAVLQFQLADTKALIVLLPSRIDAFALGALAGMRCTQVNTARNVRWIALSVFAFVIAAFHLTTLTYGTPWQIVTLGVLFTLYGTLFALVIWTARSLPQGWFARALSVRPLTWLGSISYFVYLFHEPANHLTHYVTTGQTPQLNSVSGGLLTVAAAGLVLVAGELSRRYFEGPLIAWGRQWTYGRPTEGAALAADAACEPVLAVAPIDRSQAQRPE